MTLRKNAATGQTAGTAVTVANSDDFSETGFTFVSTGGTGTLVYDTLPTALTGYTRAFKVTPASAEARYAQFGGAAGNLASNDIALDLYFYRTANPVSEFTLINGVNTAGTRRINVNIDATGHLRARAENATYLWTFTNAITLNAWMHVKVFSRNQGAGASFFKIALYDAAGTLIEEHSTSTADRTEAIAGVGFGKNGTDTTTGAFWMTGLQVETAATGYLGEATPELIVTATSQAIIDASTSTGSLSGWSLTQVSGPSASATSLGTAQWSVPIPTTGSAVWRVSATTPTGTPLTFDVTVAAGSSVAPSGALRPTGILPSNSWA